MGATIDAAFFASGRAHLAHVGDGSIFRFRHGSLETLTTPHTLANEYRRKPGFTEADVAKLPANVILRALGMQSEVGTDRSEFETSHGDVWLICSGSLTSCASNDQIRSTLERRGSSQMIARDLLEAANAAIDDAAVALHVIG